MNVQEKIAIKGIDAKRWPSLEHKKYIDIFYELTEKASSEWCAEFNACFSKQNIQIRINPADGLYIESWVRDMTEITESFNNIKNVVNQCNEVMQERRRKEEFVRQNRTINNRELEYAELNEILQSLEFD